MRVFAFSVGERGRVGVDLWGGHRGVGWGNESGEAVALHKDMCRNADGAGKVIEQAFSPLVRDFLLCLRRRDAVVLADGRKHRTLGARVSEGEECFCDGGVHNNEWIKRLHCLLQYLLFLPAGLILERERQFVGNLRLREFGQGNETRPIAQHQNGAKRTPAASFVIAVRVPINEIQFLISGEFFIIFHNIRGG